MSNKLFIARQPIFNHTGEIFAYELFYRDAKGGNEIPDARSATSSVLVNLLNQIGLYNAVGDKKAFINISANILMTDIIYSLPSKPFVFELSEDITITHKVTEAIAELHRLGFQFALDNASTSSEYYKNFSPVLPYITYVKFDTTQTDVEELAKYSHLFESFIRIAQKIEIPEIYEFYRDLGFSCFQGHIFAKPELIEQEKMVPMHLGVIKIFNMLQHDMRLDDIANEFQNAPELTLQLLQYSRSIATKHSEGTSKLHDILSDIGPKKLIQWLLMIIYSKSGNSLEGDQTPYGTIIKKRIRIMLRILERTNNPNYDALSEEVYFLAHMSLIERACDIPLATALENFEISDRIKEALISHTGELGRLYAIALSIENSHVTATEILLSKYALSLEDVADLIE